MTPMPTATDDILEDVIVRSAPDTYAAVASGGLWKPWPYLTLAAKTITSAVARGGGRVIVNFPPRHGKSHLTSLWLPVWLLDTWPYKRIILASYAAELAAWWGRKVRNELTENPFCATQLSEDSKAAYRWNTPEGGGMLTVGQGGGVTGFGGDLILIDDPVKSWDDAHSSLMRERCNDWFTGTLYDRAEPGATIILVMHRWHRRDLTGYLMDDHPAHWTRLCFPAIAETDDPVKRQVGEALCPARYDRAMLDTIRRDVGEEVWQAKFQQAPARRGKGRIFALDETAHRKDKQGKWPSVVLGVDWGHNHPTAIVGVAMSADGRRTHQLYEWRESGKVHDEVIRVLAALCRRRGDGWGDGVTKVRVSPEEPAFIEAIVRHFNDNGLGHVHVGGADNRVGGGIQICKNALAVDGDGPRHTISPDCPLTWREAEEYEWDRTGDRPVKEHDDLMDAWRYAMMESAAGRGVTVGVDSFAMADLRFDDDDF